MHGNHETPLYGAPRRSYIRIQKRDDVGHRVQAPIGPNRADVG